MASLFLRSFLTLALSDFTSHRLVRTGCETLRMLVSDDFARASWAALPPHSASRGGSLSAS